MLIFIAPKISSLMPKHLHCFLFLFLAFQGEPAEVQWAIFDKSNSGLPENWITAIHFANDGTGWFGTQFSGLVRLRNNIWTVFDTSNSGLKSNTIVRITSDNCGRVFIGTHSGMAFYQNDTIYHNETWQEVRGLEVINSIVDCNFQESPVIVLGELGAAIDSNGNLWSAGRAGTQITGNRISTTIYRNSSRQIWTLAVEPNTGHVWAGDNYSDLGYFDSALTYHSLYNLNSGQPGGWPTRIIFDQDGYMWYATESALGFYSNNKWTTFSSKNSPLPGYGVFDIWVDNFNNKWFATGNGGIAIYNSKGIKELPTLGYKYINNLNQNHRRDQYAYWLSSSQIRFKSGAQKLQSVSVINLNGRLLQSCTNIVNDRIELKKRLVPGAYHVVLKLKSGEILSRIHTICK